MSNSTIIACEQTDNTAYGIEKDNERKQKNMERIGDITIYNADCIEIMQTLPNESIDLIRADLPYSTTIFRIGRNI